MWVDKDEKRPPVPPNSPRPDVEQNPITDIEAELLWESQPHPPRVDVPDRQPYLDYGEPQDQAVPGNSYSYYRIQLPGPGSINRESKASDDVNHLSYYIQSSAGPEDTFASLCFICQQTAGLSSRCG